MNRVRKLLSSSSINTMLIFVVLVVVFYFFTPGRVFVNPRNLRAIGKFIPELGIVTLGIGVLMITYMPWMTTGVVRLFGK